MDAAVVALVLLAIAVVIGVTTGDDSNDTAVAKDLAADSNGFLGTRGITAGLSKTEAPPEGATLDYRVMFTANTRAQLKAGVGPSSKCVTSSPVPEIPPEPRQYSVSVREEDPSTGGGCSRHSTATWNVFLNGRVEALLQWDHDQGSRPTLRCTNPPFAKLGCEFPSADTVRIIVK
jgi:hypothetical protein